jgi:hypothetical protein
MGRRGALPDGWIEAKDREDLSVAPRTRLEELIFWIRDPGVLCLLLRANFLFVLPQARCRKNRHALRQALT